MAEQASRYQHEPLKTPYPNGEVLQPEPLFELDDFDNRDEHFAAVEHLVDTGVADYHDAKQQLAYDTEAYDFIETHGIVAPRGVTVELGERALAVARLMDSISVQNRSAGAHASAGYEGGIASRYANVDGVLGGMSSKAAAHRRKEGEAIEILAKTEELRKAGFDEQSIANSEDSIRYELSGYRRAGKKTAYRRRRQKEIAEHTAHTVHGKGRK